MQVFTIGLAIAVLSAPVLAAPPVAATCENVEILSDQLTAREAQAYCSYAVSERQKVERFWGASWKEPIRIHVDRTYRISRALIPAYRGNRGFMEMPLRVVRSNESALLHEIVHIYAPNGNRFLAEGLAVYLHHKLAGNVAFPNFGKSLDGEARGLLPQVDSLAGLNAVRTPERLGNVVPEQSAYVLAGSFVSYLIEKRGLPAFIKLYESGSYESAYGRPLEALESDWRAALQL